MLLAGVLAVTAAVATPALAQPAENAANPQTQTQTAPANEQGQGGSAQAAPGQAAPEQAGAEQGGGGGWMHQRGGWGMRGAHMMMQRRWMMRWDPQQRCIDRLAWRAARGAYIEAKLGLSDQQQPLWDKVQSIAQGDQRKERALCQSLKPGEDRTVLDRMNRAEQFLAARLDALRQAKPAVQALYQALTPEQQAIMDHPFRP
ncbi:MAG TPA: Spy/CpxP family protein refolding chaperone [Stellaceae bacterium]